MGMVDSLAVALAAYEGVACATLQVGRRRMESTKALYAVLPLGYGRDIRRRGFQQWCRFAVAAANVGGGLRDERAHHVVGVIAGPHFTDGVHAVLRLFRFAAFFAAFDRRNHVATALFGSAIKRSCLSLAAPQRPYFL